MSDVSSAVRDVARYLREVRPIDPEELVDYVEADVTADRVREELRAQASSLNLIERPDGRFEPVEADESITFNTTPIERLPHRLERTIEAIIEERLGSDWNRGRTGERLRERIRALKATYLAGDAITYSEHDAIAYLTYHFARSYAATRYVLRELTGEGLLSKEISVLDIGAGVGPGLAGIADEVDDDALISYRAIEPSPLADVFESIATTYPGSNVHVTLEREPIEAVALDDAYDVVVLGNVLSELDDATTVAKRAFEAVASDGSWVAIAPADKRTSIQLRAIERSLEPDATVFGPTIRLWPERRPTVDRWSFVEQPELSIPAYQRALTDPIPDADRDPYLNHTVRYSYSILRRDGRRKYDVSATRDRFLPLADATDHVSERANVIGVKLSHDIATGDRPLFAIGDGSETVECFAVMPVSSSLTASLAKAPYGAILGIEQGLILWNEDEAAINLVVDDETIVTQFAP